jgi:hypothetical protein
MMDEGKAKKILALCEGCEKSFSSRIAALESALVAERERAEKAEASAARLLADWSALKCEYNRGLDMAKRAIRLLGENRGESLDKAVDFAVAALAAERERAESAEATIANLERGIDAQDEVLTAKYNAALARLREVEEERDQLRNLPTVGGSYVEGTLNDLAHRAQVHLGTEQEKPLPDNALIAVLCDTVRLVREWERHTDAYVNCQLAAARADAVREFAEWEVDHNGGHFTRSDLLADADRYLVEKDPGHG